MTKEIIYEAGITPLQNDDFGVRKYIGLCGSTFKERLRNHEQTFSKVDLKRKTTLSSYVWDLKEESMNFDIKWKILKKSKGYSPVSRLSRLCLDERTIILKNSSNPTYLNKRTELFGKCRHRNKWLLGNVE